MTKFEWQIGEMDQQEPGEAAFHSPFVIRASSFVRPERPRRKKRHNLLCRFLPPEEGGVHAGKDDVLLLGGQVRAGFGDEEIIPGRDDPDLHLRERR